MIFHHSASNSHASGFNPLELLENFLYVSVKPYVYCKKFPLLVIGIFGMVTDNSWMKICVPNAI